MKRWKWIAGLLVFAASLGALVRGWARGLFTRRPSSSSSSTSAPSMHGPTAREIVRRSDAEAQRRADATAARVTERRDREPTEAEVEARIARIRRRQP